MLRNFVINQSQTMKASPLRQSFSHTAEDIGAMLETEAKESQTYIEQIIAPDPDSDICYISDSDTDSDDNTLSDLEELVYDEQHVLQQHGYQKIRKICDTQQGELIEAMEVQLDEKEPAQKCIIKKISRDLHSQKIARTDFADDGMTYCTSKDVIKEAMILNHLTVQNQFTCDYIVRLQHFFYCDSYYYLVLEHLGENSMSLKEFVAKSHQYIRDGKLSMKKYLKIVKFIFWQLIVLTHWLHDDMKCCHLDFRLEHIMLKGVAFEKDVQTETIHINQGISIKLCDFGSAEIFPNGSTFECDKEASPFTGIQYQSPLLLDELTYDARKADIWALGMMLFHCHSGQPLYCNLFDSGYVALERNVIEHYVKRGHLKKYVKKNMPNLLKHMLAMDEEERYRIMDVLQHRYYQSYYGKYVERIQNTSLFQKEKLLEQNGELKYIPYYKR